MILLRLLVVAFAALSFCPAQDEEPENRRPFVRYVATDDGGRLEVLFASYRKGELQLTLYGALHIADPEYYYDLQKRFAKHERLLYELISEPDLRPYPGMPKGGDHWIGMVQDGMGSGLKLGAQFDCLDYRMDNFVHADMTDVEWMHALEEAGSSEVGEMFAGGFGAGGDGDEKKKQPKIDLVKAFRNGQGTAEMRIMMAQVLSQPDGLSDQPTVIIHGRNEKCLDVLVQQLDEGHENLAIFYGAAHMEHMEKRLLEDMGWQRVEEEWVTAWDCSYSKFPKVEKGLKRKRWRARRDLEKLQALVDKWCTDNKAAGRDEEPTWDKLRKTCENGKLPGRKDGVDEWGREYRLIEHEGHWHVVCTGSDGIARTEDDLGTLIEAEGFLEIGEWNSAVGLAEGGRFGGRVSSKPKKVKLTDRTYDSGVTTGRIAAEMTALQYAIDIWQQQNPDATPTWDAIRKLHPRGQLPTGNYTRDPWGNEYLLKSRRGRWVVRCSGADGKFGTEDDV